ncbi:MAG: hypothetical protein Q8L35_08185 [Actinomycetota bacterium]|nr:hypothetical protein [Actinomycetota bacterium]
MSEQQTRNTLLKGLVIGFGIAFGVVVIFSFGMFIGEQKARFSSHWGENYPREFGGPPSAMQFGRPRGVFGGHGAAGIVIKKEPTQLLLRSPDNVEKVILIDKTTYFVKGRDKAAFKDIKEKVGIVVIGSPDNKGRIRAHLIRIFAPGDWKETNWRRDNLKPPAPSFL